MSKEKKMDTIPEEFFCELDAAKAQLAAITRFPSPMVATADLLTKEEKISQIADKFRDIMQILGLDLTDDSLSRTPYRVAKMYVEEIFSGLDSSEFPRLSFIEDRFSHREKANMVFVKANFCSFCEHHFVPINGTASVAYIPNGKIIGLSKIPRIVRFFARRPQVQERLCAQIADALTIVLDTENVAVSLKAQHFCMTARGIENESSLATTHVLRGEFETNEKQRKEFFDSF